MRNRMCFAKANGAVEDCPFASSMAAGRLAPALVSGSYRIRRMAGGAAADSS
jgi:hypothetical protein